MSKGFVEAWLKKSWVQHILRVGFSATVTLLLSPFNLEYTTHDFSQRFTPKHNPSGHIVLLSIDHITLKRLKREPEALDWAVVLQKVAQAKPNQVVSFVNPSQIQGSYDDLSFLAEIAEQMPFQFGENDLPRTGAAHLEPLAPPFDNIRVESAPTTADRTVLAKDGVTRRLILAYEGTETLHARLAKPFRQAEALQDYYGQFEFLDSKQMYIRYRAKGAYQTIRFIDVLEGKIPADLLKNKILLIGKDTLESASDYVTTPLSKDLLALSQLEMHANIIDTLILNQAPRLPPESFRLTLTFLISLLTVYVVLGLRPGRGLLVLFTSVLTLSGIALLIFYSSGWVVPLAQPLVAAFISYYFVIPYRLIVENRRSWEYYQKNRLLTQVEELKSNFIRMMSHDLKTPLARVQGMTDIIDKEKENLSETQKLALTTIAESIQELGEFIGSILSLSRIEGQDVKLQIRSKDVNQILKDVIRKHEYMAQKKRIEFVLELEPLFSIKIDADLLRTVFSNLIENAIKYSPENSKILISTEEIANEVVVQIADQGRGIPADELTRVFDRFYRAENSRVETQGNGLGLYLARYFVELHNGKIEVESVLERGSTFTVRLPMNLDKENIPEIRPSLKTNTHEGETHV